MTPEFRKAIFTWNYNIEKDGKEDLCIPLQLQRLFGMLQLSKQRSVDTVALTKSFGWDSSEVFQQQDVQELTRVLFDALEESFKGTDVENIIDELYAGELIDYLRCIDVDHQSERKDKFLDFSLAIVPFGSDKAMHSLTECIEMFLRPEILNGDNKYYAEKFDRKVDALKGLKFGRLPQIMSVQLKRFVYDFSGVDIVQKKLNDVVKFPMVLDMNKYVASKRRQTSAQDDGEEVCFDPNEEFEAFLTEQMDVLNSETKSAEKVCVSADGSSSGMDYFNMTDIDEDPVEAVPVPEEEHVSMDDDMPPLVDFTGMRAPDQVEEDALKVAQEAAAERERVLYGSLSEEAVRSLLTERGEWIYELYAVLIHSGAISGGHYYAYIKDLETQRWQNFNDSSVEPIDEQKVRQAWGENISVASYGTYPVFAKGPIKTRLSSANAYMLMYRQVTPASLGRVTFPPADSVPQYIQELVQAEEKARLERAREEEEQRNRLRIKVWWDAKEHVVVTSRTATFRNFMCAVWTQLNVGPHLMEQDSMQKGTPLPETVQMDSSSPSDESKTSDGVTESEPRFDRFRLRIYNQYNKSRGEAVDLEASGHKPLSELLINEYKHLILETRTSSLEDYEVFFKDGVSLQVEVFQTHTQTFGDTRCVRLPKGSLLLDLKHHLALSSPLTPGRMTLFKMIPLGQVEARMEVLGDDTKRLREDLNMFEGFKIFAEETPEEGVASPAWQAVMKSRSHLNVLVNKPPGVAFEFLVEGDLRWKVSELRAKVLDVLGLDPTVDIRLFKGSSRGQELREDGLTLMSNAVYAGMNIFVSLGKALRVGVHQLLVMQYTPTEGKTGVVPLPFLESEDFEETPRSSVVGSVYPSSGAKGWEAAATCNLKDIHVNIDRLGDLITDSSDPPLLAFPAPDTSDAAAAAGMYRMCGRQEDSDEGEGESTPCSVDEEVALRGLVDLAGATDEVFRGENIHNLIHTQELTAVQGADGRYGHSPHLAEEAVLLVVGEEKEEDMYAAPIVLSDSHANLVSPDTVAIVPEATLSFEQTVVCTACSADPPFSESEPKEVEPSGFGELSVRFALKFIRS
jgi:ubiquitin C-terminal hydrolase